jgi:chemotaxis protein methyltransferase CheR
MQTLTRCLEERIAALGIACLESYRERLQSDLVEQGRFLDLLTTNETFFFRNVRQFDYLTQTILPRLETVQGEEALRRWGEHGILSPRSRMRLRILCAGCSTGEEPYSVAMALLSTLRYPKAWNLDIQAVDLSETCIEAARRGVYGAERLKNIPPHLAGRYLESCGEGFRVNDEVRRLVSFHTFNLGRLVGGESLPGGGQEPFDIVFCRNVLIYFSPSAQQQLIDTLNCQLRPGGYLFTGDGEPLHLYRHDLQSVADAGCLIYRKRENLRP